MGLRHNIMKPQLALNGSTVIKTTMTTLRGVGCDPIVMVSGRNSSDLMRHLGQRSLIHVVNRDFDHTDMFHSFCLGLAAVGRADLVFLLPADAPLLDRSSLTQMLDYMERHEECQILQPERNGRKGHPVLLRSNAISQVMDYSGGGGLRGALNKAAVIKALLPLADEGLYLDVDKKEDYQRFCDYVRQQALLPPLRCRVDLVLGREKDFFNSQLACLLQQVRLSNSLALACAALDISYSNGWKSIKSAELQLGIELLESSRGGKDGGISRLTPEGASLLDKYLALQERIQQLCAGDLARLLRIEEV